MDKIWFRPKVIIAFLTLVALFQTVDVIIDWQKAESISQVLLEIVIAAILFSVVIIIYIKSKKIEQKLKIAQESLKELALKAQMWREQNQGLTQGLSEAIDKQLCGWGLSSAERDIAFLLLKGLSMKEIANLRKTSERTVRQQTSSIYNKSKLNGRAELSAYFLEDVLSVKAFAPGDNAKDIQ